MITDHVPTIAGGVAASPSHPGLPHALVPPERVATWLLDEISRMLSWVGIDHNPFLLTSLYLVAVVAMAFMSGWIVQRLVTVVLKKVLSVRFKVLSAELSEKHVFRNCGRVIPPLVLLSLIPFAFNGNHPTTRILFLLTIIYTIVSFVIAINSVFAFIWIRYNSHHNDKNLPLKGIVDILRGAMWVIAVIIIISLIVHKSPMALLTGLGAFAAVLMLVFKDSILGLVAGVQLSQNDMLRVGDWISMPGTEANGIVTDVSLVVVKVKNWNNTVSMLPPYSLVSKHFVNWRYMKEGGSRQIEMAVYIDVSTVRPLDDSELQNIAAAVPMLKDFIDVKLQQKSEGKVANVFNPQAGADGTIETNLGLMRAYLNLYVRQHPYIMTSRMVMVRLLAPTPTGFPLQVFAYLTTADWPAYEGIQAEIFEHITAIAPVFGLSVYQQPTTRSVYNVNASPQHAVPYYGPENNNA